MAENITVHSWISYLLPGCNAWKGREQLKLKPVKFRNMLDNFKSWNSYKAVKPCFIWEK